LSVSCEDFLSQSKRLCESQDEIDFRSSISRGYYSVYHSASQTAQRLRLPESKRTDVGVHERLISRYEGLGPGLRKIARRLRDRKRLRAMADYQLSEQVLPGEAALSLLEATRLIADLNRIGASTEANAER
jgi:uncharacterized protein (UPF0332 family)